MLSIRLFLRRLLLIPLAWAAISSFASADGYRIGRGDTVAISVVGYPDLTRKTMVTTAGAITLPFIGSIVVAGKTIEETRTLLQSRFAERGVVRGAELTVEIAEYAPVYVNGAFCGTPDVFGV